MADLAYQGAGPWLTTGIKGRPLKELTPTEKTATVPWPPHEPSSNVESPA